MGRNYFHLHLVSDSTGETLIAVSRAATTQYQGVASIEHVYPLVRNADQLDRVMSEIEAAPGLVLMTLVDREPSAGTMVALACRSSPRFMPCCNPTSAQSPRRAPVRSTC
jgi:[pyruvate, water dikinase]-phosphate phosphotransferase / [pyruvate, water dikinase] kinase